MISPTSSTPTGPPPTMRIFSAYSTKDSGETQAFLQDLGLEPKKRTKERKKRKKRKKGKERKEEKGKERKERKEEKKKKW